MASNYKVPTGKMQTPTEYNDFKILNKDKLLTFFSYYIYIGNNILVLK